MKISLHIWTSFTFTVFTLKVVFSYKQMGVLLLTFYFFLSVDLSIGVSVIRFKKKFYLLIWKYLRSYGHFVRVVVSAFRQIHKKFVFNISNTLLFHLPPYKKNPKFFNFFQKNFVISWQQWKKGKKIDRKSWSVKMKLWTGEEKHT